MKRNNFEIYADVLKVARSPQRKTHLVYKANLNFGIVNKYINYLVEKGWLRKDDKFYSTTEEGEEFLDAFVKMHVLTVPTAPLVG